MKTTCFLCLLTLRIFVSSEGECLRIEADETEYPCTEEVMLDTGCWDASGQTELCNAAWIEG